MCWKTISILFFDFTKDLEKTSFKSLKKCNFAFPLLYMAKVKVKSNWKHLKTVSSEDYAYDENVIEDQIVKPFGLSFSVSFEAHTNVGLSPEEE